MTEALAPITSIIPIRLLFHAEEGYKHSTFRNAVMGYGRGGNGFEWDATWSFDPLMTALMIAPRAHDWLFTEVEKGEDLSRLLRFFTARPDKLPKRVVMMGKHQAVRGFLSELSAFCGLSSLVINVPFSYQLPAQLGLETRRL